MDGEFSCEDTFGTVKGVAGGNLIFLGRDQRSDVACDRSGGRGDSK